MALVLNGSNQGAIGSVIAFGYPILFVCWARWTSGAGVTMASTRAADDAESNDLRVGSGGQVRAVSVAGGSSATATSGTLANSNWHHFAAYYGATNNRICWLDGGTKTTNTATRASGAPDVFRVGRNTSGQYFNGSIAYASVYSPTNEADADAIIAELQTKAPSLVSPEKLLNYWKLVSDATDSVGGNDLTLENSPSFDTDAPSILDSVAGFGFPFPVMSIARLGAWIPFYRPTKRSYRYLKSRHK